MFDDERPDYSRWTFYIALIEFLLDLATRALG